MDNETVVRTLFERFFNQGDATIVEQLVADEYDFHNGPSFVPRTRDAFIQGITWMRSAFPDMHWEIGLLVASGDLVSVRSNLTGTHLGDFMTVAPTGRRLVAGVADFYRLENGRIVEHWDVVDVLALLLGAGAQLPPDLVANADMFGLLAVQGPTGVPD